MTSRRDSSDRVPTRPEDAARRYTLQSCYKSVTGPVQGSRNFRPVVTEEFPETGENMRILTSLVVLSLVLAGRTAAQTIEAGPVTVKIGGRINYQFNTTSVDDDDFLESGAQLDPIPASTFEMRRFRLRTNVAFENWLTGELEADFAGGRVQLRNAFINYEIAPAFQVRAGQFKKPFSLLQLTSSSTYPVIERGVRIRGLEEALEIADNFPGAGILIPGQIGEEQDLLDQLRYQNYDLGAEVHGSVGRFGYAAGVFNGAGSDRLSQTNDKAFAARGTIALAEANPLVVGFGVSRSVFPDGLTADDEETGLAWEADLEWGAFRRPGIRVLAEVTSGENELAGDATFLGAQGVIAFFQPIPHARVEGWEIAARASYGDPRRDVDGDAGLLLTPGINLYFFGRNRLMLNWDVYLPESDRFNDEHALRAQAQIYF